jgi:hypothetical protein
MDLDVVPVLPLALAEQAWHFYRDTFDDLRFRAVQRHLLHRHEFDEVMNDQRVLKYVAAQEGQVIGLSTMTADLEALPLVSADFFAHHYPELYEQRRIFYVLFTAAQRGMRGAGVFAMLVRRMIVDIIAVDGVVVLDTCSHNETEITLPETVALMCRRVAGTAQQKLLDKQSFWLYEFPAAS